MGELKSAWEIAQEKAKKLGDLSPEEKRQQKEKECLQIAKALVDKYFAHPEAKFLATELAKYDGTEKELITRSLIRYLVEAIDIRFSNRTQQALDAIQSLDHRNTVRETLDRIKELLQEYSATETKQKEEIEKSGREILHQLRVSGSAISRINIRARQEWQKKLQMVTLPFEETLKSLKQKLLE